MASSARVRKKKDKSVFDASHFEESDDSEPSVDYKQVRFKRKSTTSGSSRDRSSKTIGRYPPILQTISVLVLLLIILFIITVSDIGFTMHISPYIGAAVNFTRPLISATSSPFGRPPKGQVPPYITEYVQQAITTALGSTLQCPNFALRTRGAIIVPSLMSEVDLSCEPEDILEEEHESPSGCFFAGDRGQFAIQLSHLLRPTYVTINGTPTSHAMARNAPHHLLLWGLVDGTVNKALFKSLSMFRDEHRSLSDGLSQSGRFTFLPFANFTFNIHGAFPIQMFPVHPEIVFSAMSSGLYILEIRSNWGGNMTGIRRIRLHGEQVP